MTAQKRVHGCVCVCAHVWLAAFPQLFSKSKDQGGAPQADGNLLGTVRAWDLLSRVRPAQEGISLGS